MPAEARVGEIAAPDVLRKDIFSAKSGLVSGAGSGIGRAIAVRLGQLGMTVTGVGRNAEKLAETERLIERLGGRFEWEVCDLRDESAAEAAVERVGARHGIDVLVNNAGGQFYAPASEITRKGFDAVIAINLAAVFTLTRAAYPFLKARRGSVVNISLSGVDRGAKGLAHSLAARAGVLAMSRTMALEWAADGVRLNCIGPGVVATEGLDNPTAQKMLPGMIAATPAGRATTPEEVAELTAFLASEAGALMTGQLIQIDGGAHLGPGLHMIE